MESGSIETHLSDAELAQLLRDLGSRNAGVRTAARYALGDSDAATIELAFRALEQRGEKLKHIELRAKSFAMLYQVMYLASTVIRWVAGRGWESTWWGSIYSWGSLAVVLPPVAMMAYRWYAAKRAGRAICEISTIEDNRVVPPLINALDFTKLGLRDRVVAALITRLPVLSESDRSLINPSQQAILTAELSKATGGYNSDAYRPRFGIAILKALEAIGDDEAIPTVRMLAERPHIGSPLSPVIAEARRCLDVLIERQERERDSRVLLRASDTPGETLLKPVGASDESVAAMLVRPAGTFQGGDRVN